RRRQQETRLRQTGLLPQPGLLPALFHLLLAVAIRWCRLNNPVMSRIATDLRQRHVQS
ncbi:MAG: hypothetical protein E7G69_18165, partial [Enterobacter sp.]|nr:hypothetical protein [Enterobacter sp.]